MMKPTRLALLAGLLASTFAPVALADPAKAQDDAYSMAVYYKNRDFAMAPQQSALLGGGQSVKFLISVTKGLDYVFLVGCDQFARDIDLYVYDEVGSLIIDDRRAMVRAGVKFRSSYSGTVQVYLVMQRADGLASYSVLVGRRGVEPGSAAPAPQAAAPGNEDPAGN
jgi:hypothetical protein